MWILPEEANRDRPVRTDERKPIQRTGGNLRSAVLAIEDVYKSTDVSRDDAMIVRSIAGLYIATAIGKIPHLTARRPGMGPLALIL